MRRKKLHRYPVGFWQILRLSVADEYVRFATDSPTRARYFREEFYHFRSALKEATILNPKDERLSLAYFQASQLSVSIEGTQLTFSRPANPSISSKGDSS